MKFRYIAICFGMGIVLGVWGDRTSSAPFLAAGMVLMALTDKPRKGEGE